MGAEKLMQHPVAVKRSKMRPRQQGRNGRVKLKKGPDLNVDTALLGWLARIADGQGTYVP